MPVCGQLSSALHLLNAEDLTALTTLREDSGLSFRDF